MMLGAARADKVAGAQVTWSSGAKCRRWTTGGSSSCSYLHGVEWSAQAACDSRHEAWMEEQIGGGVPAGGQRVRAAGATGTCAGHLHQVLHTWDSIA